MLADGFGRKRSVIEATPLLTAERVPCRIVVPYL